jgi:hypothetical protein
VVPVGGLDSQAQQGLSGPISPCRCWPLPPLPCVVHPPPLSSCCPLPSHFLFDCCVLDWGRRGGQHSGRVEAVAVAAQWRRQRQRGNGGSAAAARRRRGIGGGGGGNLAAARQQRVSRGSFPSAWRWWQKRGSGDGGGGSAAAVVAGWQQRGGGKQRGVVFLC